MIQMPVRIRIIFGIFAFLVLIATIFVIFNETSNRFEWKRYQIKYHDRYETLLTEKIDAATQANDEDALKKWAKLKNDLARASEVKIRDVFLPGPQVRDLCMTCHIGVKNTLFADAENPLKAHPQEILKDHTLSNYGCTLCHHGQGVGLSIEKAHGFEHNWEKPRIPMEYVQSSCFECHETVYGLKGAEKAAEGKQYFVEFGCYGCHDANVIPGLPKFSSPFSGIAEKIQDKQWIAAWLDDPAAVRPGTIMPGFRIEAKEINDIVAYIYTLKDKDLSLDSYNSRNGNKKTGKQLFSDKGCIGCHSFERDVEGVSRRVPVLADAGLKMSDKWLYNWISRPASINPDTWMPEVEITDAEVKHLTAYLSSLKDKKASERIAAVEMAEGNKDDGKNLAQSLGCLGCHRIKDKDDPARVGVSVADVADKRMEELPFGNSDVPHTKWDWIRNKIQKPVTYQTEDMPMAMPDYVIPEEGIQRLTLFYLYNRLLDLPEQYIDRATEDQQINEKGDWMVRHFNCKGCHEILNNEKPRIDSKLAKKSMVPPRIVNEVEKVQPQWLYDYLRRPTQMRPWLHIRMPQFNFENDEIALLMQYLYRLMPDETQAVCSMPYEPAMVEADYDQKTLDMGKYRFRNDKCMQCHPVNFTGEPPEGKKLEDLSIDLMLSKSRLRFRWIKDFLRDPDVYAGVNTKMPFVFYTPDGVPRIPDPEIWIQRTALFLMFMEEVPEPVKAEEKTRQVQSFDFDNY
ncbi:MAG: c-type cytochrome [Thermodesulfobacteriota bacterium]|nr:c-type cytochrome [Thermodesulfobacteriota bacterium]